MRTGLPALSLALLALGACRTLPESAPAAPGLVHSVYFTLKEDTPETRARLVESCYRNLAPIDGVMVLVAGPRDESLERESNDLDFDVALTIVFRDRNALDQYLPDARHQRLVAEHRDNLARIRVFDSSADTLASRLP